MHKKLLAIAALFAVGLLVFGAVSIRKIGRSEEKVRQTVCMSNLKRIRDAIEAYRKDHDDRYPDSLVELHPGYLDSLKLLVCPGDVQEGSDRLGYTSYLYVRPNGDLDADAIIVTERRGNHSRWGRDLAGHMVLRANGNVEWVSDWE